MSQITGVIAGKNKVKDYQLNTINTYILSEGKIQGLEFNSDIVSPGKAVLLCERGNDQKFLVDFHNTEDLEVVMGNEDYLYIHIPQNNINLGDIYNANTDGTGIGRISTNAVLPTSGAVLVLGKKTAGVYVDLSVYASMVIPSKDGTLENAVIYTDNEGKLVGTLIQDSDIGKTITIGPNKTLILSSASLNITGLPLSTNLLGTDEMIRYNGTNVKNTLAQLSTFIQNNMPFDMYGNGSDGDVVISSGTTTLVRDMYYNNLTLNSPGTLNPNGYKIFVKGTFSGNGTVRRDGNIGGTPTGTNTFGGGGAPLNAGSLNAEIGGGNGGYNAIAPSVRACPLSYGTATGGNGGYGQGNHLGATAGVTTKGGLAEVIFTSLDKFIERLSVPATGKFDFGTYKTGGGAGGGGGGNSSAGYGGGGGGGNGGMIFVAARIFNFTGTNSAVGGRGGGTYNNSQSAGNGGGGTGGTIFHIYSVGTSFGTLSNGGGLAGVWSGAGQSGSAGQTGASIRIQAV